MRLVHISGAVVHSCIFRFVAYSRTCTGTDWYQGNAVTECPIVLLCPISFCPCMRPRLLRPTQAAWAFAQAWQLLFFGRVAVLFRAHVMDAQPCEDAKQAASRQRHMAYLRSRATWQGPDWLWEFAQRGLVSQVQQWLTQPLTCKHGEVRVRHIGAALRVAVVNDEAGVVHELLAAHARLEAKFAPNQVRQLPLDPLLMVAAKYACGSNVMWQLLQAGATVQYEQSNNGITPLQIAAKHDNMAAAYALLEAGAYAQAHVRHRACGWCDEDYPIGLAQSEAMARLILRYNARPRGKWLSLRVDPIPLNGPVVVGSRVQVLQRDYKNQIGRASWRER